MLKRGGLPTLVGGNIGLPVIELIAESRPETWDVLEVSSFQLETVAEFRPRIAAVLNITPDHLDRHRTFANYAAAKARITERQDAEDFLVLNAENQGDADGGGACRTRRTRRRSSGSAALRPIKQGAFVHGESVVFLGEGGRQAGAGDAGERDPAEGGAQCGERAGGGDDCAAGGGAG